MTNAAADQLKTYGDIITADDSFFPDIMQAVNDLHKLFTNAGAVDATGDASGSSSLKTGIALSSIEAGRCAFDLARTRQFARGIRAAVTDQLSAKEKRPLQILYAGCGPYALLAMLTLPYFSSDEIRFLLVDIHSQSTDSVKKLIQFFGIENYFEKIITADALTLTPEETGRPDILLIETMNSALQKEPQVSMAMHLVPFLHEDGVLIPENIVVQPVFTETKRRMAIQMGEDASSFTLPASFSYEPVAILNKETAVNGSAESPFKEHLFLLDEDFLREEYDLELQTTIQVWKDISVQTNESGITLPVRLQNAKALAGEKKIRFYYVNNETPGFKWETETKA